MGEYIKFLLEILYHPKAFQSDFSRYHAAYIAEAASRGHISCVVNGITKGRWHVTEKAFDLLRNNRVEVKDGRE